MQNAESLIQCKYYEGTEYVHSVIKDAVIHMLRHFGSLGCQAGQTLRYRVYGHYKSGQEKLPTTLDLAFIKKHFFSYREKGLSHEVHNELGIDDTQLGRFLSLLDVDIRAPSYDVQQRRVRDLLASTLLGCNADDAEAFHYPRAINAIQKLAVQADPAQRTITRADFISAVDQKDILKGEQGNRSAGGALPIIRHEFGQHCGHMAFFEMPRQQGKPGQQAKQVGNRYPFMSQVPDKTSHTQACLEAGEQDFVEADRKQPGQGDVQGCMVKQRNTEQGQTEQDEIQWNASHHR